MMAGVSDLSVVNKGTYPGWRLLRRRRRKCLRGVRIRGRSGPRVDIHSPACVCVCMRARVSLCVYVCMIVCEKGM